MYRTTKEEALQLVKRYINREEVSYITTNNTERIYFISDCVALVLNGIYTDFVYVSIFRHRTLDVTHQFLTDELTQQL